MTFLLAVSRVYAPRLIVRYLSGFWDKHWRYVYTGGGGSKVRQEFNHRGHLQTGNVKQWGGGVRAKAFGDGTVVTHKSITLDGCSTEQMITANHPDGLAESFILQTLVPQQQGQYDLGTALPPITGRLGDLQSLIKGGKVREGLVMSEQFLQILAVPGQAEDLVGGQASRAALGGCFHNDTADGACTRSAHQVHSLLVIDGCTLRRIRIHFEGGPLEYTTESDATTTTIFAVLGLAVLSWLGLKEDVKACLYALGTRSANTHLAWMNNAAASVFNTGSTFMHGTQRRCHFALEENTVLVLHIGDRAEGKKLRLGPWECLRGTPEQEVVKGRRRTLRVLLERGCSDVGSGTGASNW